MTDKKYAVAAAHTHPEFDELAGLSHNLTSLEQNTEIEIAALQTKLADLQEQIAILTQICLSFQDRIDEECSP